MPECKEVLKKLFNTELVIKESKEIDDDKPEKESKMKKLFFKSETWNKA